LESVPPERVDDVKRRVKSILGNVKIVPYQKGGKEKGMKAAEESASRYVRDESMEIPEHQQKNYTREMGVEVKTQIGGRRIEDVLENAATNFTPTEILVLSDEYTRVGTPAGLATALKLLVVAEERGADDYEVATRVNMVARRWELAKSPEKAKEADNYLREILSRHLEGPEAEKPKPKGRRKR
jgi:hypothetical protein